MSKEFELENRMQWIGKLVDLFSADVPDVYEWKNVNDIAQVLNAVSGENLCHLLFPDSGGLDLSGVRHSAEHDCIELDCQGSFYVLKPRRLLFHSFADRLDWSYFWLEADRLELIGEAQNCIHLHERVREVEPAIYTEYPSNREKRVVTRYIEGVFLLLAKTAPYNQIPECYDGRHNQITDTEFHSFIHHFLEQMNSRQERSDM